MPHEERPKVGTDPGWCRICLTSWEQGAVKVKLSDGRIVHRNCYLKYIGVKRIASEESDSPKAA